MTEYYLSSFVSFEEKNYCPTPKVTVSIGDLTQDEFEVFVTEIKKIPFVFSFWIEDEPQEIGDQWKQTNGSLYEIMIRKRKDYYTVREKLSLQSEFEDNELCNEREALQIFVKTAEKIRNLRDKYSASNTQTWGEKLKKYDDEHPLTPEELERYKVQLENLKAIGQHAIQHAVRSSKLSAIECETKSDVLPRKKKSRWTHEQREGRKKNIKSYSVALSDTEGIGTVKAEFAEIKIPEPQGVVIEGEALKILQQIKKNTEPKTVEKAVYQGTFRSGMQAKEDEEDPIEKAYRLKQAGRKWEEVAHTLADEYPDNYSAGDSEKIRKAVERRFSY